MADRDTHEEAVRQVEEATDSERLEGADLLESDELKRQLADAKKRLASESAPGADR